MKTILDGNSRMTVQLMGCALKMMMRSVIICFQIELSSLFPHTYFLTSPNVKLLQYAPVVEMLDDPSSSEAPVV